MKEVARFQRRVRVPVPLCTAMGLSNVGPIRFDPDQVYWNLRDNHYECVEIVQLCHASGDCPCQQHVTAYMNDDRWEMIADVYTTDDATAPVERPDKAKDDGDVP